MRRETNVYRYAMTGVCFGAPAPRWFAISPKNINGRTWQEAEVGGLGQTQCYDIKYNGTKSVPRSHIMGLP